MRRPETTSFDHRRSGAGFFLASDADTGALDEQTRTLYLVKREETKLWRSIPG